MTLKEKKDFRLLSDSYVLHSQMGRLIALAHFFRYYDFVIELISLYILNIHPF